MRCASKGLKVLLLLGMECFSKRLENPLRWNVTLEQGTKQLLLPVVECPSIDRRSHQSWNATLQQETEGWLLLELDALRLDWRSYWFTELAATYDVSSYASCHQNEKLTTHLFNVQHHQHIVGDTLKLHFESVYILLMTHILCSRTAGFMFPCSCMTGWSTAF